jgi:hypothetical protein
MPVLDATIVLRLSRASMRALLCGRKVRVLRGNTLGIS